MPVRGWKGTRPPMFALNCHSVTFGNDVVARAARRHRHIESMKRGDPWGMPSPPSVVRASSVHLRLEPRGGTERFSVLGCKGAQAVKQCKAH